MGLLDQMWADPSGQALSMLGAGLLGVRRGNEGRAIAGALAAYNEAQQSERRNRLTEAQMDQMRAHSKFYDAQAVDFERKNRSAADERARLEQFALTLPAEQRQAFLLAPQKWAESQFRPPKEETAPNSYKEYERAKAEGYKGSYFEFMTHMKQAGPMALGAPYTYLPTPNGFVAAPTRGGGPIVPTGVPTEKDRPKVLPPSVAKEQQTILDQAAAATGINQNLDTVLTQIEKGELKLGLGDNVWSRAQNAVGASSPNSRNFGSFMATLEKMRNESLRLNTGVQTEGDAQRAWNELMSNVTDGEFVKQRLREIKVINQRAANAKRAQIDILRTQSGVDPMSDDDFNKATGGSPSGPRVAPAAPAAPPKAAVDMLKANPLLAPAFDEKYGPGSAQRVLGY